MTTMMLVLRGLGSRRLLTAATLVLTVVAMGGTVLGPAFQDAVTRSYTLTRLVEAEPATTGLTFVATPGPAGSLGDLRDEAVAEVRATVPAAYGEPEVLLRSGPFADASGAVAYTYASRAGLCDLLVVEGRCPRAAGEVLLQVDDLQGRAVGDDVRLPELGRQRVVGSYETPEDSSRWLLPGRLASRSETATTPYTPAPVFVVPGLLAQLPRGSWGVTLDSRLTVPASLDEEDLTRLAVDVERVKASEVTLPGGGRLVGEPEVNSLGAVVDDVREQRDAARASMTPAVVSLALVALAVLLRLLTAAADQRAGELALASLRGLGRRRTWALGLAEPLLLLAVAAPLGVVVGLLGTRGLADVWLRPGTPVSLPTASWVGGGSLLVVLAGVAAYAVGRGLREPLATRVAGVRRPDDERGGAGRAGGVVEVLVVVAAVVLPLTRVGRSGGLGLLDLLLPVVAAVASGLVVTRLTRAGAAWWTRRRRGGPMSWFVAVRGLARRSAGTLVILPVAAAIAVAVFAAGVGSVAAGWRESAAATAAPADEVWEFPGTPIGSQRLTRELDPDGRWLMSMARLDPPESAAVVAVDTTRLARVARWSPQWIGPDGAARAARLVGGGPPLLSLDGTRLTLRGTVEPGAGEASLVLVVVGGGGDDVDVVRLGPYGPGTTSRAATAAACAESCEVREVRNEGTAAVRVSGLTVDDVALGSALTDPDWRRAEPATTPPDPADPAEPAEVEDGALVVDADTDLVPAVATGPLPALVGDDVRLAPDGDAQVDPGRAVVLDEVGRARSLPQVGPVGVLVDETALLSRLDPSVSLATAYVLVRSDVPDDVRTALRRAGLTPVTAYAPTRRALDDGAYGQALRLYLVVSAALLSMALVGLLVSTAVQMPGRRRDAAALRVVGVPRRTVVLASLWESVVVLGAAALAGLAAGVLAQRALVGSLTLGRVEQRSTPAVLPVTDTTGLLVLVGGVVATLLLVSVVTSVAVVRGARGATLRESAR